MLIDVTFLFVFLLQLIVHTNNNKLFAKIVLILCKLNAVMETFATFSPINNSLA